jgi:hypothetical protein
VRHDWTGDLSVTTPCPACGATRLRPDIVWFGEMPFHMAEIEAALPRCDLFVSIGTSGSVYPAADFVERVGPRARIVELNLEPSQRASLFAERRYGRASVIVPAFVEELLAPRSPAAWSIGSATSCAASRGSSAGSRDQALDRAVGCLLGQVIGDNLGALVEFCSAAEIRATYPEGVRNLHDGGTWNILAGQPTDDSELALALARSLVAERTYDAEAAASAYARWYLSAPFDMGNTIRRAFRAAAGVTAGRAAAAGGRVGGDRFPPVASARGVRRRLCGICGGHPGRYCRRHASGDARGGPRNRDRDGRGRRDCRVARGGGGGTAGRLSDPDGLGADCPAERLSGAAART